MVGQSLVRNVRPDDQECDRCGGRGDEAGPGQESPAICRSGVGPRDLPYRRRDAGIGEEGNQRCQLSAAMPAYGEMRDTQLSLVGSRDTIDEFCEGDLVEALGIFAKLPSGYQMQGLPDLDLPDTAQLMMLYGSNQEKGAIVIYRAVLPDAQGGSNVRDKPGNCGGPVIWWGSVTKAQAQAACVGNSKVP